MARANKRVRRKADNGAGLTLVVPVLLRCLCISFYCPGLLRFTERRKKSGDHVCYIYIWQRATELPRPAWG